MNNDVCGLSVAGCRLRQQRFVELMRKNHIDRTLVADQRHVYYLSGYWSASYHRPLLLLNVDGSTHLVLPVAVDSTRVAADKVSLYESHRLGTLLDDQLAAAMEPLTNDLKQPGTMAADVPGLWPVVSMAFENALPLFWEIRRAKDADELALIRCAIRSCEAAYRRAAEVVRAGVREIDVFAEMQSAAVKELGEPIGELGNDFQAGTPGGPPRRRAIEQGELMPLDVGVSVRGYRCDLCRTFSVDRAPTVNQLKAAQLVKNALEFVEQGARIGSNCRELYESVAGQLDGINGWRFSHHLGHGIGLSPHEAPRLNPYWNDFLQVGDVFTVEPGLYHESLRGGVRIEHNYWMSEDGLVRLSEYPTTLVPPL
ncbi:MAG: Xaa-Pro peptidase family protein [Pirellulales bacterium]